MFVELKGKNFFTKLVLDIMKAMTLSKFCFIFTLRQGTIMIASVELSLSTFAMILLLLCLSHANHLVDVVTADIEQFERQIWFHKSDSEVPPYIFGNERKMVTGQHLAMILKVVISVLLFVTTIYFISSVLLMYGAIRRSPSHLLPWTSVACISLVTALFWFLPFCYFIFDDYWVVSCVFLLIVYPLQIYAWLTVFSYYRQLTFKQFNNVAYVVDKLHPEMIKTYK